MSLRDLELRQYARPIETELNKQKEKNGLLKKEIKQLRAALRSSLDAMKIFPNAYPDGEWKMKLHEEGCIGTRSPPDEREDDGGPLCACDGDYSAEFIEDSIAAAEKLVNPKKEE